MKFKGEGRVNDVMGRVIVEFVGGQVETEDEFVIQLLLGKGFVPVVEHKAPVVKKNDKE